MWAQQRSPRSVVWYVIRRYNGTAREPLRHFCFRRMRERAGSPAGLSRLVRWRRRVPDAHRRRDVGTPSGDRRQHGRDGPAALGAMARPRSARWPGCARRSFSLTARNTSRESARASRAELDPMRTLDRAHVRERAFPDVSDVRSRSLPGTDCETMSRGPSSLAVEPHRAAWIVEAHHREAQPSALGVLRVAAGRSRLRRLGAAADARAARSSAPCRRDRRR
jgi:hypothetical protein